MATHPWDNQPGPDEARADWHRQASERDEAYLAPGPADDTETTDGPWSGTAAVEERHPTRRPAWLSPFQAWPCGRCGERVADESHPCSDNPRCGNPNNCTCRHGCDIP